MDCLDRNWLKLQKGIVPKEFKTGYPFFLNDEKDRHAMIATSVDGVKFFMLDIQKIDVNRRWVNQQDGFFIIYLKIKY